MVSQDDHQLSPVAVQDEIVGVDYSFPGSSVRGDFAVHNVLRAKMNRQLPKMVPVIMEELALRIDQSFGLGNEWREVKSHELVRRIIGRVSARIILGSPLCKSR